MTTENRGGSSKTTIGFLKYRGPLLVTCSPRMVHYHTRSFGATGYQSPQLVGWSTSFRPAKRSKWNHRSRIPTSARSTSFVGHAPPSDRAARGYLSPTVDGCRNMGGSTRRAARKRMLGLLADGFEQRFVYFVDHAHLANLAQRVNRAQRVGLLFRFAGLTGVPLPQRGAHARVDGHV